jgi:hypothetical protein
MSHSFNKQSQYSSRFYHAVGQESVSLQLSVRAIYQQSSDRGLPALINFKFVAAKVLILAWREMTVARWRIPWICWQSF